MNTMKSLFTTIFPMKSGPRAFYTMKSLFTTVVHHPRRRRPIAITGISNTSNLNTSNLNSSISNTSILNTNTAAAAATLAVRSAGIATRRNQCRYKINNAIHCKKRACGHHRIKITTPKNCDVDAKGGALVARPGCRSRRVAFNKLPIINALIEGG